MSKNALYPLGIVFCLGCNDGASPASAQVDSGAVSDANGGPASNACGLPLQIETPSDFEAYTLSDGDSRFLSVDGIDEGRYLNFQFYPGRGVFVDGVATGTYEIAGTESEFSNCALCVSLRLNVDLDVGIPWLPHYMATSGTVTIESIGAQAGERFTASFSDIELTNVEFDSQNQNQSVATPECKTQLLSFDVDETID